LSVCGTNSWQGCNAVPAIQTEVRFRTLLSYINRRQRILVEGGCL
jgi:hypothetical protein